MSTGGATGRREEPDHHGASGAGRWADYLDWLRAEVAAGVLALPEDERRRSRLASGWTPLELLSHVMHMERRWFVSGFLGERVADPWGDWNMDDPWLPKDSEDPGGVREGARWQVPGGVTAEQLLARLEQVAERTREVLRTCAGDERAAASGPLGDDPPTLEWICFHVVAEYARHLGHLDIVVELGGEPSGA